MNNIFGELKRRNVFRVAGVYAVVGWVIAQIATTLKEALGLPEWFDASIVALLLLGFPIALVFAWAFELTPDGVVRTEDVPEDHSIAADTGRKLDVAIIVGIVALVAITIWQPLNDAEQVELPAGSDEPVAEVTSDTSIAVLPFDDLSPEGDQEYFSDGIAEEILNVLVRVEGLDVASRTSSFQFKGRGLGIPQIADELNVRHVVEGSVRKSGDEIRVTAQLIDSSNDRHLWSDTYDSPLTTENIFHIQDEIARAIVDALSNALGVGELKPIEVEATTRNLDAYELFLQARPLFHARTALDVADELLHVAVAQDPEYSEAWEMLAALQPLKISYGYSDEQIEVAEKRGMEYADRALAIEADSATALAVKGMIAANALEELRGSDDVAAVLELLSEAIEIDPRNASALNWRGLRFMRIGYLEEALQDFATCMKFEPYYVPCVENHFTVLGIMGRDEESVAAYLEALNKSTTKLDFAHYTSLARLGEELAFKSSMNSPSVLKGWRHHDELWEAYRNPDKDYPELIESVSEYLKANPQGYVELVSFITHPIGSNWRVPDRLVVWDRAMRNYRQTEIFKNYIRESGVHRFWRENGFPPQCRPILGSDDFECD